MPLVPVHVLLRCLPLAPSPPLHVQLFAPSPAAPRHVRLTPPPPSFLSPHAHHRKASARGAYRGYQAAGHPPLPLTYTPQKPSPSRRHELHTTRHGGRRAGERPPTPPPQSSQPQTLHGSSPLPSHPARAGTAASPHTPVCVRARVVLTQGAARWLPLSLPLPSDPPWPPHGRPAEAACAPCLRESGACSEEHAVRQPPPPPPPPLATALPFRPPSPCLPGTLCSTACVLLC